MSSPNRNPGAAKKDEEKDPLREHDLAAKLAKDVSQAGNVMRLKGYVGSSDSPDTVRLYLNLNFDEYLVINKKDILHAEEAPEDVLEFGGTYIWVRKDANITHIKTESTKQQAKLLEGEIARAQVKPQAVTGVSAIAAQPRITLPVCPSEAMPVCGRSILDAFCPPPTHFPPCPPPTYPPQCPISLHLPQCPPHSINLQQCPVLSLHVPCHSLQVICQHITTPPTCPIITRPEICVASGNVICVQSINCPSGAVCVETPVDPTEELKAQIEKLKAQVKKMEEEKK